MRLKTGFLAVMLTALAVSAVRAADPPPTSQPDAPTKMLFKVILGDARRPSGLAPEPWISEKSASLGLPHASEFSPWTELGEKTVKLTPPAPAVEFSIAMKRDTVSELLMVQVGGKKPRSLIMLDQPGERELVRLADVADGKVMLVALEVVTSGWQPTPYWGEPANNMRVHLRVEPAEWSGTMEPRFVALLQQTTPSGGATMAPMWGHPQMPPLEIFDSSGRQVQPKTTQPPPSTNRVMFGGNLIIQRGGMTTDSETGEFDGRTLTMHGPGGLTWKWTLPPGRYLLRASLDLMGRYMVRASGSAVKSQPVYSQRISITITPPPATQPDSKGK